MCVSNKSVNPIGGRVDVSDDNLSTVLWNVLKGCKGVCKNPVIISWVRLSHLSGWNETFACGSITHHHASFHDIPETLKIFLVTNCIIVEL